MPPMLPPGRPAAYSPPANPLARAFGGEPPAPAPTLAKPKESTSAYPIVALRETGADLWGEAPAFGTNGIASSLDQTELGATVRDATTFEVSTWLTGLSFLGAILAPWKKVRKFFRRSLVGATHAKVAAGARALPGHVAGAPAPPAVQGHEGHDDHAGGEPG